MSNKKLIGDLEFQKNLREIVDVVKHSECKDCVYYKLGYSFADGFICKKNKQLIPVCIHDQRLKNLRKNKKGAK